MATFLEVKQLLGRIFTVANIDESSDIEIPDSSLGNNGQNIVLPNEKLKEAFDAAGLYTIEKLEMYTKTYREVLLQYSAPITAMRLDEAPSITDTTNKLSYAVGPASIEYSMFLLGAISDGVKAGDRTMLIDIRHRSRMIGRREVSPEIRNNPIAILPEILRAYTLKISSENDTFIDFFREYASSYEFLFMYKQGVLLSECNDVQDMYSFSARNNRGFERETVDTPPLRIYNSAVLDYYAMAMEARDPFTMYISFYHVVEHYFDEIFRKKLSEEIKDKLTHPDFSYKDENKLFELAKFVRKRLKSDDDSGKGNEYDSLGYVLREYVPIEDLKARIGKLDSSAVTYYQAQAVPFVKKEKSTKIAWSDAQGVYTGITTRIYETRNALVHSKSDRADSRYRPYEDRKALSREIALIRSVAELVIINSSEAI